jgi:glycosyltransferase involved in cell wall biosynthesis
MDMIIRAFNNMPDKKLVLIGDGYDSKRVRGLMKNSANIVWLGYQHDDELILYMQNARACIFAAKEDFGIMCVEAQATGTPVLALKYGGYLETVAEGLSGYFFEEQTVESIMQAVNYFEQNPLCDHAAISAHAAFFSAEKFREAFGQFVHAKHQAFMHRL